MKKSLLVASQILQELKDLIHSPSFQKRHRISEKHFTRNTHLSFSLILFLILNQIKKSIASEIFNFCNLVSEELFTKSAFTKARTKLSPNVFIELNNTLINSYYHNQNVKKIYGMIVVAIDGYKFQLPDSKEILEHYGSLKNQTDHEMPAAQCSEIYDVINGLVIGGKIESCTTSERELAISLIDKYIHLFKDNKNKFLFLFDRGYPSILFLLYLITNNLNYVMRCNNGFFKEISDILKRRKKDSVIEISLKNKKPKDVEEIKKYFPNFREMKIKIRVVLIKLKNGEIEILLTSLIDKNRFKFNKFKKIYFLRWGIEEGIKFKKIRAEIENISGKRVITIEQDYFSTVLCINVTALLAMEAKKRLLKNPKIKNRKYKYEINYNLALGMIKNTFVVALNDSAINMHEYCETMMFNLIMDLVPIRNGRNYERQIKHPKRRFHPNQRRAA